MKAARHAVESSFALTDIVDGAGSIVVQVVGRGTLALKKEGPAERAFYSRLVPCKQSKAQSKASDRMAGREYRQRVEIV